jgi:hypothetical protein
MSIVSVNEIKPIEYSLSDYAELYEKYFIDLRNYINISNIADPEKHQIITRHYFNLILEQWQPILGFSADQIKSDIREIQTPKTAFISSYNLRYALQNHKPGSNWLIPNILRNVGLQLLIGATKVGKSKLVYCLIYSVTVTQKFMNRPVKPGKVLFYQLEEPEETINERLFYCGFGNSDDEMSSLIANFGDSVRIERLFRIDTDIDKLIRQIAEYKPSLVIIDSLRKAALHCNISENSTEMGKFVYTLQQVASYTGTCIVLIHHKNKNSKSDSVTSSAGSTSIISASDGVLDLSALDKEDTELITLKTLPRNGIPIRLDYRIKTDINGFWTVEVEHEEAAADSILTQKVLRFLGSNIGEYYNKFSIAKAIGVDYRNKEFSKALFYLQNSQIIRYQHIQKTLMYCLDKDSGWIVNPQDMAENLRAEALLAANSLITCTSKSQLRNLVKQLGVKLRVEAQKLMFSNELEKLANFIALWEYKPDDEVLYQGEPYIVQDRVGDKDKDGNLISKLDNKYALKGVEKVVLESQLTLAIIEESESVQRDVNKSNTDETIDCLDSNINTLFDDEDDYYLDEDTLYIATDQQNKDIHNNINDPDHSSNLEEEKLDDDLDDLDDTYFDLAED